MIKIHSRNDMYFAVQESPKNLDCVILYEPNRPNEKLVHDILAECRNYIAVAFHDIAFPREGYIEPKQADIASILEWAKNYPDDIHVACRAGVSRSSAVAYLIACTRMSPDEAIKILDPNRHTPNELILKIGGDLLGEHILPPARIYLETVTGYSMI